jgi:hypothetical protein
VAFAVAMITAAVAAAQQPAVQITDDEITIRGCVSKAAPPVQQSATVLVWTRGDIMLSGAAAVRDGQTVALTERVFYWLDDDEDLAKHVGQTIEVKGELDDFETGELEIERDEEFTNISLEVDGETERARVPTAWLGAPREGEFDIAMRRIDVEDVDVLGPCTR